MADYYPLIARAVQGLADSSPETRRGVYERARAALTHQLRSLDPPLSEDDISREQVSLNEAIERVEAGYMPEIAPPTLPLGGGLPNVGAADRAHSPPAMVPAPPAMNDPLDGQGGEVDEAAYEEEPTGPARPRVDSRSQVVKPEGRGRAVALSIILALVIGAIAVAAWYLRDTPTELPPATPVAEAPAQRPAADGTKFNERVSGGPAPAPASPPGTPGPRADVGVAQRAIFYEEDPTNPQLPKANPGRVVWRLEAVNAGQGQPLETAVRAVVEIADSNLTLNLLMRRNQDQSLPASHTVELTFSTAPGDPGKAIRDVGLLQFKNEEASRGTPIAGLPVPVRENLFLIGMSNLRNDIDRNMELILRRKWIDLPIRTVAGQRAILSIEKGAVGDQVLNDAFRQWQ